MTNKPFMNFRKPVEYIIKQWDRKRDFKNKINTGPENDDELPSYPVFLIRNENTKEVEAIYYGSNDDPLQWSQELFRDSKNNKVYKIRENYPDGSHDFIWIDKEYIERYDEQEENKEE